MKILLTGGSGMVGRNILNLNQNQKIKFLHPTRSELNLLKAESVHSFLLKNRGTIIINDIESATFAHGLHDNDVIEHDYFGTEMVVNDLKMMKDWDSGVIEITPECMNRSSFSGFVVGISDEKKVELNYA